MKRGTIYMLFTLTVLGAALGSVSQTATNVMMGAITTEFGVGIDLGQWLTTLYMLALGIVVPVTTYLVRRLDDRQYIMLALVLMMAGSALCVMAPYFWALVVGRVLQAASTGILMPQTQNFAMHRFPAGRQTTAMGISGIAMGFAPNIGPTVGGFFVSALTWRAFFLTLGLLAAAFAVILLVFVPKEAGKRPDAHLDLGSFMLSAIAFGGLLTGLSNASSFGVPSAFVGGPIVIGVVFMALFLRRQRRVKSPLINLDIFDSRRFRVGFWTQNLLFGSFMGITLVLPLYIENLCGGTPADAGLVLLPAAVCALVCNPVGGILADRFGQARVIYASTVIMTAGALLALTYSADTPLWFVAATQAVRGFGISSVIGSIVTWSLRDLPKPIISHGSSFALLVRQACASLGTTLMVFCIEMLPSFGLAAVVSYRCAFGVSAVLSLGMCIAAFAFVTSVERASAKAR